MKNKFYKEFTKEEILLGYHSMKVEIHNSPIWILNLFSKVWDDFEKGKFSYDGATFVKERYEDTIFEVASFVHDWYNHNGYVGNNVDSLFVKLMYELNYRESRIKLRKSLMNLTFLNVLTHKYIRRDYKGDIDIESEINKYST